MAPRSTWQNPRDEACHQRWLSLRKWRFMAAGWRGTAFQTAEPALNPASRQGPAAAKSDAALYHARPLLSLYPNERI
jgi:hypothetical protein